MSRINIIVAASNNNVIGKGNDIPWKLPTDLKNFKQITDGSVVIMGRKCWESLPEKFRPLPNRLNMVVTKNELYKPNGCAIYDDLGYLLTFFYRSDDNADVFVIGGGQIYKAAFRYAEKLHLTRVLSDVEGDVYLEGFNETEWKLISRSDVMEENGYQFVFEYYEKIF